MIKNLSRPCPICLNKNGEILHTQNFIIPQEHFLPDSYDVVACNLCGFVYADTSAKQKDYDRYYQTFSKYEDTSISSGTGITKNDAYRLSMTAQVMADMVPDKNCSILDIGCANGGLLASFKSRGYNNLTGMDPSKNCVTYVKEKLGIHAIEGGLFFKDNLQDCFFDIVILSHVLEHVYDLTEAIKNVKSLIKREGLLYIEVPDGSAYASYYVVPYYYFDCEHINHFDEHSLKNLLLPHGFNHIISKRKELSITGDIVYPACYGIYRKSEEENNYKITFNPAVKDSVVSYVKKSESNKNSSEIDKFARTREKIIVWGAGSYTLRLLKNSSLGECNIIFFIDKDSKKQGTKIKDITIYPPDILKEHKEPVIICSALYSEDILAEIKAMDISNTVFIMK